MLVVRIEPVYGRSSKVRVVFDGAMDVCLYPRDLKRLSIDEGSVVSRDELYGFFREVLLPRAKSRALHLLERQDRTRSGLVNKLLEGGYPVDVAEEAVAYVEELGYVDDERYARQYISYHKKQASCRKLGMDLVRRGIDRE